MTDTTVRDMNRRSFIVALAAPLIVPSYSLELTAVSRRHPTAFRLFYLMNDGWGEGQLLRVRPDGSKLFPWFRHKIKPFYGKTPPMMLAS